MEQFFKPTRLFQDMWEVDDVDNVDNYDPFQYTEVELSVPVETFLNYSWDFADLCAFASSEAKPILIWIGDDVVLTVDADSDMLAVINSGTHSLPVLADLTSKNDQKHTLTLFGIGCDPSFSTEQCTVLWRAIRTSNCVKLRMEQWLVSGSILSQFLEGSPSLQVLELEWIDFKEDHCRALATLERTNLEVTFSKCKFEPQDADGAFIEWFRHSNVVTSLYHCKMEASTLAALSGNNSVKNLTISGRASSKPSVEEMRSLLQALPGNRGIEDLSLNYIVMSDETWSLFFRSLSTHPRIKRVCIVYRSNLSAESMTTWTNAIFQMLQDNTVLQTIDLPDPFKNEAVYQNAILPRLEMNRSCFEEQRQAVKRADPSIRPQLLGRALHVVRYNPDLVFRFLSENVPAFVRAEEEDSAIPLQINPAIVSGHKRKAP
jgi:hypothetical protein